MTSLAALLAEPGNVRREVPLFPVEAPDGLCDVPEISRQVMLFRDMRILAPTVFGFAIPNAGKRNPVTARKEGICGGAFDTEWHWDGGSAWVEMKGYDKRGYPGKLSGNQIAWGNRMHLIGKPVACFFDPSAAVQWLKSLGAIVLLREGPSPQSKSCDRHA